jgi:GPH family glycoside/pentoside/hexuronide:cation symporter
MNQSHELTHDAGAVQSTTSDASRLPLKTKLAYGVGDVSAAISAQVTGFFLTAFLLDVARIRPGTMSIIILLSNLWEAITDPIVGNLSDRTRTRWGRRRPWLLFGALPFGLAFLMQWMVPPFDETGLFIYYLLVTVLLKTAFTAVNVPYTAMTPDQARDYDERTRLTSYRFAFSILGGLLAVVLYPTIAGQFGDAKTGSFVSAGLLAIFIVLSAWTTFFFTRERPVEQLPQPETTSILTGVRIALKNRPFVCVLGIYLLSWLVVQFVQANLLLFLRYWMNAESQFRWTVLLLQLTALAFLPVWAWVSRRLGKKQSYYTGILIFIPTLVTLYFLQPGQTALLYAISFPAGISVSMLLLIPWSMLPDVVDYDELQTGQRREGVYYGLFVFMQNMGLTGVLALSAWALELAGYINPETAGVFVPQPETVQQALRLMVSLFPAVLMALSVPLAVAYPITRQRFAAMRAELDGRNRS